MTGGPERMAEMVTMLAVASEVLALLAVQLASASADVMPALAADAKTTMGAHRQVLHGYRGTRTPPARGRGHGARRTGQLGTGS
jgi:hypothetical protein